jgi:hypothetical protein
MTNPLEDRNAQIGAIKRFVGTNAGFAEHSRALSFLRLPFSKKGSAL